MGKRGPKPTPTQILKLRGSQRADYNHDVPPPEGLPDCPDWLEPVAKDAWAYLVPMLDTMGVLSRIDGLALARYCQFWARWKACEQHLMKHGWQMPLKNSDGTVIGYMPMPEFMMSIRLSEKLSKLEADFGMTPSARSRVNVRRKEDKPDGGKRRIFTG